MSRDPTPHRSPASALPPLVALLLLSGAAIRALAPIVVPGTWQWQAFGMSAAVLIVAAGVRALGVPAVLATLMSAVVAGAALIAFAVGGTALLGVIPLPGSLAAISGLVDDARATIVESVPPAPATAGLTVALVAAASLAAAVNDLFAHVLRTPLLATLIPLGCVVMPPLVFGRSGDQFSWLLLAAGVVVLLWATAGPRVWERGRWIRSSRTAVVAGLIAILAVPTSLGIHALLPRDWNGSWNPFAAGALTRTDDPFVTLAQALGDNGDETVFEYSSPTHDRPYFTLAHIVDLDGDTWLPDSPDDADAYPDPRAALAAGPARDLAGAESVVDVTVHGLRSFWLPTPAITTSLEFLSGTAELTWSAEAMTAVAPDRIARDTEYRATFRSSDAVRRQLGEMVQASTPYSGGDPAADHALTVPPETPQNVRTFANEFSELATPFEQAEAIVQRLAQSDFVYSEAEPRAEGYTRSGVATVGAFLETRAGYCVHFASTMVLVARELGIPARIAIGYLPGGSSDEAGRTAVTRQNMHAWAELYFEGVGWIPFEPTPAVSAGVIDRDESDASPVPAESASPSPMPEPTPSSTLVPAPSASAVQPDPGPDSSTPNEDSRASGVSAAAITLGAATLVVTAAFLAGPWLLRRSQRRRRIREGSPTSLWAEIVATAVDAGLAFAEPRTARALATRIGRHWNNGTAVFTVLNAYERSRYAEHGTAELAAGSENLVAATRSALTSIERAPRHDDHRLARRIWPRSVLEQILPRRRPPGSDAR